MTVRRIILCTAAAGILATAAPGTASAAPKDRCVVKGRTTVATTTVARAFSRGSSLYVCLKKTGKVTRLFTADDQYTGGAIQAFVGRFVAYDYTEFPACKADCPPGVETQSETTLVDARTGKRTRLYDGNAARVALTSTGAAAWLEGSANDYELHVRDAGGERVVDAGNIRAGSLKARGGKLRWTNAGTAKSIAFR